MTGIDIPKEPGKEWRITTPENVDLVQLIQGELAMRAMASALDWDFREIEKPRETEVTPEDIRAISKEAFGVETYGTFALDYLDWMKKGAVAQAIRVGEVHHVSFAYSAFHFDFPTFNERLDVEWHETESTVKKAAMNIIDTMPFPFTHTYYPINRHTRQLRHPSYGTGWHVASIAPDKITRERLSRFLQTPQSDGVVAPVHHTMHGTVGRALDVLCLAAGLKETVDPSDTETSGGTVPYKEFLALAEREGVTKGRLRTLTEKLNNSAMRQILRGRQDAWGEAVLEGEPKLWYRQDGFRTLEIDEVSISTLATIKNDYERLSPELADVLAAYE